MSRGTTAGLNVLLIDNFDSFSHNLTDEFEKRGCRVSVWRNDVTASRAFDLARELPEPRLIVLSPGPGAPGEAGCTIELIRRAHREIPIFGVCLGHQAMVEAFGGEVGFAGEVVHGKAGKIVHDGTGIFAGLPSPMLAARYHSLAARRMPDELTVTATLEGSATVMALAHQEFPTIGVQFHPESMLTPRGGLLIDNVVAWASKWTSEQAAKYTGQARG